MKDISQLLAAQRDALAEERSLTYRLEHAVGGYFVRGEGGGHPAFWLTVYHDARYEYNDYNSMIELVPENVAAYVSTALRFAFVRADHLERFRRDAGGFGLACAAVADFAAEALCCADLDALPAPLNGLPWGASALDPSRFSVRELVRFMNGKTPA